MPCSAPRAPSNHPPLHTPALPNPSATLPLPNRPNPVVRKVERVAHVIRHPADGLSHEVRYHTTGKLKRGMHRAVEKYCCSIQ